MGKGGGGEEKALSPFRFHLSPFPPFSAPTGAGKSLTFELAPYTFDRLFGEDCNAIVLVIVPLISLMKDQVSNLNPVALEHRRRRRLLGRTAKGYFKSERENIIWESRGDRQQLPTHLS